jgi:hypothetical protein
MITLIVILLLLILIKIIIIYTLGVVFVLVFLFVRSLSARRAWEIRDSTGPPGGRARAFWLFSEST